MNEQEPSPRGTPPLAGRAAQTAILARAYADAITGQSGVVALVGEPGIGKTRLLDALAADVVASGGIVLRGGASEAAGMPPYLPFLEALGRYIRAADPARLGAQVGALAPTLATILPELPERLGALPPGYPLPAEQARLRLYEAVGIFLAALAADAPVLLLLDDLHWADAASLDLLAYLLRVQPAIRLLVAIAYRPGAAARPDPPPPPPRARALGELNRLRALTTVPITPLPPPDIAALAAARLGGALAPVALATLHARSEGNPFFAEELLRNWHETGALAHDADGWHATRALDDELPATIAAVIAPRLARLDPASGELLRTAAAIGRRFDPALLATVVGRDVEWAEERLAGAVAAHLLRADADEYTFAHDTIRAALYAALTPARRRRLHGFIGRALEDGTAPPTARRLAALAFHYRHSGDRARGARYAGLAGRQARAAFAFGEALAHYRDALALLDPAALERPALLLDLGEAASLTNAEADAVAAFTEAETLSLRAADSLAAARAAHGAGRAWWRQEAVAEARAAYERGLAHLAGHDSAETVAILNDLVGLLGLAQGRPREAAALAEHALALAERLGDRPAATAARRALGDVLIRDNDFTAGLPLLEAALAAAEAADDPASAAECCAALFHAYAWLGETRRAWAIHERQLAFARRSNDLHQLRHVYAWEVLALVHQGHWDPAYAVLDEAEILVARLPNPEPRAFLHVVRATLAWLRGDYPVAEEHATLAIAIFRDLGPGALLWYLAPLGIVQIQRGKRAEALTTFAEVEALLAALPTGTVQTADALSWLAVGATLLGDRARAARLLPLLEPFAGRHTDLLIDRVRGELATVLGDWPTAERLLAAAEAQARAGGVLAARGRLARARGGPGAANAARALLADALAHYDAIGLAGEAGRVRAELAEIAAPPAPRPTYPGGLSAREVEVLRLVAAGQSNRTIAAALSLSERTVGNHLTNIFNKLGVDNRAAATAFALRNGLA